jgi:16S rRNA (guanine(966)-N(2))-methyltransferase RsmD
LRITGGKYRGRKINPPANLKVRPTTDFARESLFNILRNRIDFESVRVLDLFSGTGSISYEFASRGAQIVHLVERDMKHFAAIKRIIKDMGFSNIKPVRIDVKAYLKTCQFKYNIIFADPPYNLPWLADIPDLVIQSDILNNEGFIILEHPGRLKFDGHKQFFEHRNYGSVNFSFFRQ